MGISLNKQKLMYEVLAPSIMNSYGLVEAHLCVRGWLSVKTDDYLVNLLPSFLNSPPLPPLLPLYLHSDAERVGSPRHKGGQNQQNGRRSTNRVVPVSRTRH